MDTKAVVTLVEQIAAVPCPGADHHQLVTALGNLRRLQAWCTAREVAFTHALQQVSSRPELDIARATGRSLGSADKIIERARTSRRAPQFESALDAGTIASEHVDALTRALKQLEPSQQPQLLARGPRLIDMAELNTPEDFARKLSSEVRAIQADDGMERLARQKRAARLKAGVDPVTGMYWIRGEFDPVTGAAIDARLRAMMDTLHGQDTPTHCPTDSQARQDWLRAAALVELINGNGPAAGRPEFIVVIDTRTPDPGDGGPLIRTDLGVQIPRPVIDNLWNTASIMPVPSTAPGSSKPPAP